MVAAHVCSDVGALVPRRVRRWTPLSRADNEREVAARSAMADNTRVPPLSRTTQADEPPAA